MRNSGNELWLELQRNNLTRTDYPENELDLSPWYIKTMQGFAGWIAALFLLAFVGTIIGSLFIYDNQVLLALCGFICCTAAYFIFRNDKTPFLEQLGLAISLCGQFMVAWGIFTVFSISDSSAFLILALFQGALALIMPNFLHRVFSSWFAMVALFWGLNQQGIFGLDSALAAALFTLIWIREKHWYKYRSHLLPISFGLAISLLQFSGHFLFQHEFSHYLFRAEVGFLQQYSPLIGSLILAGTCLYLVFAILSEQNIKLASPSGSIAVIATLMLLGLSFNIAGVSSALLILLVGFFRQRLILMALGILALISFISWYYYSLSETLLVKSIYLLSIGAVCLTIVGTLHYFSKAQPTLDPANSAPVNGKKWISLATILIVLAAININIYQKESLIREGQSVLLELAPVDPRSLMQGDYMRLRYRMSQTIQYAIGDKESVDGFAIVQLDQHSVAQFITLNPDAELSPQQHKLHYRIRDGVLKFATNAFFFQEGSAKIYEKAKYGEFKVSGNGEMLLVGLRDKQYVLLGTNRP
ncbi:GDYXXLXY domain-containing protein [Neptuniibacter marinus]|uniref:GDYXXLXY domain-containing protein n=1 Tax=Neptuniibacter marinus TaxID=1806670 RepID=UPI00082C968F|nr:GDYXXLXY domain-containing protein [Neptuniibacter marinus]